MALWVLLQRLLVRDSPREDERSADSAGEILAREMRERREKGRGREDVMERLAASGAAKLDLLETALEKMRESMPSGSMPPGSMPPGSMPEGERACLTWVRESTGIRLFVNRDGKDHILALGWTLPRSLDLETPGEAGSEKGSYRMRDPEGREAFFPDLESLVRNIAAFIADILA